MFPENRAIYKIMLKSRARHLTHDKIMLHSRDYISVPDSKGKNTDTIIIFDTFCFFNCNDDYLMFENIL